MNAEVYEITPTKKEKIEITTNKGYTIKKTNEKWSDFFVFQLFFQSKLVFEFLGKSESDIFCSFFQEGIFYWYKNLLGYYKSNLHLQRKKGLIINIFCKQDCIHFLENRTITRFKPKNKQKKTGLFKLSTEKILFITNLFDFFSKKTLKKSFLFSEITEVHIIASLCKIGVIKDSQIIQILNSENEILSIKGNFLESVNKLFYLSKKSTNSHSKQSDFVPNKKTLLALSQFSEITETVDLFFYQFLSSNLDKKLANDWHLEPLDREFLSSEEFYQEKLYDYLQKYLNLTVQGLYLTCPDSLLLLQEALREQEARIYADGHLLPDKTIASLITRSLPLPSFYDNSFQANIRSLFLKSLKWENFQNF